MNKIVSAGVVTVAVAAGLTIGVVTTPSAEAATWHQGTPKILRGKWVDKIKQEPLDYYPYFDIKANGIDFSGNDPTIMKNMRYHHRKGSAVYYVKGHETFYSHGKLVNYFKFKFDKSKSHNKSRRVKYYVYRQIGDGLNYKAKKAYYGHYFYK